MQDAVKWKDFVDVNQEFPKVYHRLFRGLLQMVLTEIPNQAEAARIVISQLIFASAFEADDVLLLCYNDRQWAAFKLLRTLFERTVTLKFIALHPEEADAFTAFDPLDWFAITSGIEKNAHISMNEQSKANLANAANAARTRFRQDSCDACGMRKQTSWTTRSSLELARAVGLDHLHLMAFVMPSKHIHPTYYGTQEVLRSEPALLYNILKITHTLTLEAALSYCSFVHGDPFSTSLTMSGLQDFLRVWKYSETNFGLSEQDMKRGGVSISHT